MNDKLSNAFISLIDFLKKEYKYKLLGNNFNIIGKAYLANKHFKYQMIIIDAQPTNGSVLDINERNQVNTYVEDEDSILIIKINAFESRPLEQINGIWTIQTTPDNIKNDLMYVFADINKIDNYSQFNDSMTQNLTQNEADELKVKNFNSFLGKLKNNNVKFTWVILLLFIVLPAVTTILGQVLNANYYFHGSETSNIVEPYLTLGGSQLAFGGTNRSLAINGGQWWRIFTYGFSAIDTGSTQIFIQIIFLFIICSALFSTSRITEIITGSQLKIIIPFVLSYISLGFIASTTLPTSITSGSLPILGIMIGILLMNISGDKTPVSLFARARSVWPIAILVLVTIMSSDPTSSFAISFLGVVLGSAFSSITKTKPKNWVLTEKLMLLAIVFLLVIGVVFIFVLDTIPAENPNILSALEFYLSRGIISEGSAENLVDKIGWNGDFKQFTLSTGNGTSLSSYYWIPSVFHGVN